MNKNTITHYKVCKKCGNGFTTQTNAHKRVKYCKKCRSKMRYNQAGGAKTQRNNFQKRILKKYSKKDLIQCLICKKWFRQLGTHIVQVHKITTKEYRRKMGFDVYKTTHTLTSTLRKLYGKQAMENKTYKNLEAGAKYRYKKGDKTIGCYQRSKETLARLNILSSRKKNMTTIDESKQKFYPKFKAKKFKGQRELEKWIEETTKYKIEFKDEQQDCLEWWIDEGGEILHANLQSKIWNGMIVDLSALKVGKQIGVMDSDNEQTKFYDFIIKKIIKL